MKIMNKGHFLTGSMLSEQHVYNLPQGQIPQSRQAPGIFYEDPPPPPPLPRFDPLPPPPPPPFQNF